MIPSFFAIDNGLDGYLRKVHKFPMLEEKEEFMLAKRWRDYQDCEAVVKLVNSHLRLVAKIAAGYRGYGLPFADLIAEGNIGLLQSLDRFNPDMGYRFSTYARWWIQAAIQEHILKSWSLVKMGTSAAQKKLFFNLRRLKSKLGILDDRLIPEAEVKEIAAALEVSEDDVKMMDMRLMRGDASLNAPVGGSDDSHLEWQDWLPADNETHEEKIINADELGKKNKMLEECIHKLNPREFEILKARRLTEPPKKLEELAEMLHVSKERVRQIEVQAFQKLQQSMKQVARKKGWAFA